MDFVDLFEKGDFVQLGLDVEKKFKEIDNNKKIPRNKKYESKCREVIEKFYNRFDPIRESENFFDLDAWDLNKLSFVVAVDFVARGLKMSQVRKILNISIAIYRKSKEKDEDVLKEIGKLNYTLAYTLGRHKEIEPLAKVLGKVLPKIDSKEKYEKVHEFLQAVVAYHKLLGGRD